MVSTDVLIFDYKMQKKRQTNQEIDSMFLNFTYEHQILSDYKKEKTFCQVCHNIVIFPLQAAGISVEFCSHVTRTFIISVQFSKIDRANEALNQWAAL